MEQTLAVRAAKLLPADQVERKWAEGIKGAANLLVNSLTSSADRIWRAAMMGGVAAVEREMKAIAHATRLELAGPDTAPTTNGTRPKRAPLTPINVVDQVPTLSLDGIHEAPPIVVDPEGQASTSTTIDAEDQAPPTVSVDADDEVPTVPVDAVDEPPTTPIDGNGREPGQ